MHKAIKTLNTMTVFKLPEKKTNMIIEPFGLCNGKTNHKLFFEKLLLSINDCI